MSENLNEQVIVGFFADAAAADQAADALRNWDKANEDVKLGVHSFPTRRSSDDRKSVV